MKFEWIQILVIGYFLGSIPFSFIVASTLGKTDIRKHGSGNVGATNIARTLGTKLGLLAFAGDLIKGVIASLIGWYIIGQDGAFICGAASVFGHCFPIWLKFKGGKGVSTATGVILTSSPHLFFYMAIVQIGTIVFSKYMSLASIISGIALPIISFLIGMSTRFCITALFISILVIAKHHSNIKRLMSGNENKFSFKSFNKKNK